MSSGDDDTSAAAGFKRAKLLEQQQQQEEAVPTKHLMTKKIYIPLAQYPSTDFVAILDKEKERIEEQSQTNIYTRGGSADKEPLHVLIEGASEESVHKADRLVRDVLFDPERLPAPVQVTEHKAPHTFGRTTMPTTRSEAPSSTSTGGGGGGGAATTTTATTTNTSATRSEGNGADIEREVRIPKSAGGGVIGREGSQVKKFQADSGARIHVTKDLGPDGTRTVVIRGKPENVHVAVEMINKFVEEFLRNEEAGGGSSGNRGEYRGQREYRGDYRGGGGDDRGGNRERPPPVEYALTEYFAIPNSRAGAVIGRQGTTIRGLQSKFRARVAVPSQPDPHNPDSRVVEISADDKTTIEAVKNEIASIVEGTANFVGGPDDRGTVIQIPNEKAGLVIGRQGATIKAIQERTQTRIQIPSVADPGSYPPIRTASVVGPPDCVANAIRQIQDLLAGGEAALQNMGGMGGGAGGGGGGAGVSGGGGGGGGAPDYSQEWQQYYAQASLLPHEQREAAWEVARQIIGQAAHQHLVNSTFQMQGGDRGGYRR